MFLLLWLEGHMANKILIPLLSLVSCFLKPPMNRQAAVGATEGLWQGLLLSVSQRLHSLLGPVAVTKEGGDSSVLNLFCAKDQANENCEHRSGIWQIFRQFMKWIPQHIFSTDFSSLPSTPLSVDATAYKVLGRSSPFHF